RLTATLSIVLRYPAAWRSAAKRMASSVDPHARLGAWPRLEYVYASVDLCVIVACSKHHAFGDAKTHLARGQVGHQHGQLVFQIGRGIRRLDAGEDLAVSPFAHVQRKTQKLVGTVDFL